MTARPAVVERGLSVSVLVCLLVPVLLLCAGLAVDGAGQAAAGAARFDGRPPVASAAAEKVTPWGAPDSSSASAAPAHTTPTTSSAAPASTRTRTSNTPSPSRSIPR